MILNDDDPKSQEHRALAMQLLKHLRSTAHDDLPEALQEVVSAWLVEIRIRVSDALPRSATITTEVLPTCLLFHIRMPYAGKSMSLDHRIDYTIMRRVPVSAQGYLQAEADMLLYKTRQFLNTQTAVAV